MKLTQYAHNLLKLHVKPGDFVIDATVGNGYDTLCLAQLTYPGGHVIGFDIQEKALENTRHKLKQHSLLSNITLHLLGHEELSTVLPKEWKRNTKAIIFNLGYLPQSTPITLSNESQTEAKKCCINKNQIIHEQSIIKRQFNPYATHAQTTLIALSQSLDWLHPEGILLCTAYPGHTGGDLEHIAVRQWCENLQPVNYQVMQHNSMPSKKMLQGPTLWCIKPSIYSCST